MAKIENIERIRFTTSHPHEFKDDLVEVYESVPELVSHVHLPVQSGSDRILKLMRRRYTVEKYLDLIDRIKSVRPNMSFSSDFIVGFPDESEEDFQATMDIVNEVGFDESYSFIYSPRPNTPASEMPDSVPQEEKKLRLDILQNRLNQLSYEYSRKMVGSIQNCLITARSKKDPGEFQARTINDRVDNFRPKDHKIGDFVNLKILDAYTNSLRGEVKDLS